MNRLNSDEDKDQCAIVTKIRSVAGIQTAEAKKSSDMLIRIENAPKELAEVEKRIGQCEAYCFMGGKKSAKLESLGEDGPTASHTDASGKMRTVTVTTDVTVTVQDINEQEIGMDEPLEYLLPGHSIQRLKYRYFNDDGTEIEDPAAVESQKMLPGYFGYRGVRPDAYVDDDRTIYNIERQTTSDPALPSAAGCTSRTSTSHSFGAARPMTTCARAT